MAAEVPVCDVLCEAMEYLSKLGSNLRTRSENLKDKRIRKDKLKNAHAIQRAAQKVLLICELSKKSLENVETGVRNVLSIVDASQTSSDIGGKRTDEQKSKSKHNVYVFEHESCKLRISKKISLKHYTSVKVLAKPMPISTQDKYPVFYDCKLKRQRIKDEEKLNNGNEMAITVESEDKGSFQDIEDIKEGKSNDCELDKKNMSLHHQKSTKIRRKLQISEDVETQSDLDTTHEQNYNGNEKDKRNIIKSKLDISQENGEHLDTSEKAGENTIELEDDDISLIRKNDKVDSVLKSSKTNCEEIDRLDNVDKYKVTKNRSELVDQSYKSKSQKEKENQSSSDEEIRRTKGESPPNKVKLKSDNSKIASECNTESNSSENVSKEPEDDSKPKIRCVNITKLLKPDVLGGNKNEVATGVKKGKNKVKFKIDSDHIELSRKMKETKQDKSKNSSESDDDETHRRQKRKEVKFKRITVSDDDDNDAFWAQKRKEVKQFKPKKFTVNVEKINLCNQLLLTYKLNRITQGGKTVFEIKHDTEKGLKELPEKINKVKNALLEDSDNSDNDVASVVKENKKSLKNDKHKNDDNSENVNDSDTHYASTDNNDKISGFKRQNNTENLENSDDNLNSKSENNLENSVCRSDSDRKNNPEIDIDNDSAANRERTPQDADSNDNTSGSKLEDNPEIAENIDNSSGSKRGISPENAINSDQMDQDLDPKAVKNALLNDSDSDKDEEQVENDNNCFDSSPISLQELEACVAETIKKALLIDSDSDKQDKHNTTSDNIKSKESSNENNISQNNEEESLTTQKIEQTTEDPEQIKSHLLNDSSDSQSDSEVNKISKKEEMSKRKHAIRSKRAKKMLLNYSSSDNEKGKSHSDSDSQTKKRKRKKSYISSSSSEEDRRKKKKQRDSSLSEKRNDDEDCKMVRSKPKPSGSSGQNSDNQDASDKDIDGLTNLNSLHKTHRRRDSTSTNDTESRSTNKKTNSLKVEPIIGENLLQAMSSSEQSEDDHGVEEELPPMNITGLNGDGVSHLAKDDLLGVSDSSVSQDKEQNEDTQNAEDSEEESVKLKRRKANAISSDSEGGSARRKQADEDVRVSDFEDSEEESSEPTKRTKRKKKGSDSDASGGSSNDGGQKKRRRIKQVKDSDISGSDTENEGRNKHGRKNIRKVMGKNQLEEATKKAAREEKERIARIAERQKLYNNLDFDESGKPDEVVLEKVVLDFDPETKEPLIEVDRGLVKKLKPHQANGIKFMWDACFESVKRIKKDRGSGCILAHCMGLGKTLQVISLTHTLLTHGNLTGVNRVLVVCPLSTVLNWVNEIRMWLKHADSDFEVDIYELSRYKQNSERAFQLQQWFEGGGVCVLGYEMFRNLSADNPKKFKKKMLRSFQESLVDPGPDLVVCDEGHLLKNEKTSLSQSMNRVKTRRRIVLTGTPLQNNLKEYYCMVQFVKPNLLGKYNEYLNRFVNPITNGQYTDSTEHDIKVMKRRSHVLHKMLDGAVQRRDYGVLAPFLPPKHEYVLFITLTDVQVKLYQHYLDNYSRRPLPGKSSGFLFPDFQSLQRIWTHPLVLKYNSERYEIMQQKKREREEEDSEGSLVDFIDDDSTPEESSTEESTDDSSELSDDSRKKSKKKNKVKKSKGKESKVGTRRGTRANPVETEDDPDIAEVIEVKNENPTEWWIKLVEEEELEDMRNSHKLVLLFDILRQCEAIGDKLLVFSQSLYSLDLIEHFLNKVDEATQEGRIDEKLGGHVGSWSPGVDYFRLDGSTSCENRSIWCKNFNREDNPRARLFLISTRAGGLGINLVAANRVVIFDVSWNPSHDVQSIFRVYRFGQKKPCYIYRFLAMGTMEEKIYERQVTKQAISKRVIDEQQIDRHYAENDLAELYKFEARPAEPRPLPTLPKDRLFAEMLKEHEAQIYKYHEHDSLLENKEEETLSEEERKAAWEDFENEKNKPPPAPFPSAWPMHNGMVSGLIAQQQQQLMFAAMASMLRKEMPNITDNQLRDMLPVIYNANPGLMQKMSEIYKYPQAGMMNPGMMNPVMNPGGGASVGGTSGLQYEPPWQRQHQQQQQMRLQQLMQQQNQMGAKFYAGGLGSRDPVAMALQQQRAREIMMGGAGGAATRPRGRPPLAPRAPQLPQTTNDVVNLDSD